MSGRILMAVLPVAALQFPVLRAAAVDLDGLLSNPPFAAHAAPAATGAAAESTLEFRGVLVDRGESFFSLREVSSRLSLWVGLNEPGHAFVVESYDPATEQVTVQYQGRTLTLSLKQAVISAAAAAAPIAAPAGSPPGLATDEARRLAAVAEEVRRRRALREQAAAASAATARPTR